MDHWPDIDRCRKLEAAGFPQKTLFWWCTHGPRKYVLEYGENECNESTGGVAAPIVTELVEEIKKLLAVPTGDAEGDSMLIAHFFEHSCSVYVPTQTLRRIANHADTLPNALSDLWLWLRGREK